MFKNKNESNIVYKCTVRLLEDADILECEFQPFHRGSYLVDFICDQLKIKEKDYFGLRYVDVSKQRHWLDLGKSVIKQCKDVDPILFSFRVKFYPADPFRLTGNGRIMLYQQLKRDLRHGRLYCSIGEAAALGSLIVQEEIGDYNEAIHIDNYVSSMNLALRQTETHEKKIMELHKKRQPYQDPSVAVDEFMGIARGLETYGIDPHPVKDHRGSQLYIGINYSGISTFISGKRSQHFRWNEVHKINFEGKMFIAHLSYTDASREPKKHTIGFKCSSNVTCRYLWRCAIEQMLFFTLPNSQHAAVVSGGGFFSWGTKFKYTGRTEREILTESINALREQKLTNSSTSKRKASSVPATPSSPQGDLAQIRYSSLPRSTMSEPLSNCTMPATDSLNNIVFSQNLGYDVSCNSGVQVPSLEPVSEEARMRASTNFDNINMLNNCSTAEMSKYYLKSEDSILYSSPESTVFNTYDSEGVPPTDSEKRLSAYFQQQQSNNTAVNSCLNTSTTSKSNDNPTSDYQYTNSAKGVRKFHFINAFIPSFVFVVIAMTISAIIVLESDSDLFEQIRNLPEMISLRYQYYQPLKEYIIQKVGRKT
ncbi:FERM domain-containing protein 5 isoform X2 [Calliphora vicina]|uniref:FERM domain-containing protein 5 isoform X2 n=1 Tax=Calliphora vicina TaxID=7373 RepID=UPI00325A9FB4